MSQTIPFPERVSDLSAQARVIGPIDPHLAGLPHEGAVRLFKADATGNRFLIVLGHPAEVAAAVIRLVGCGQAWSFDSLLSLDLVPGGTVLMRVWEQDGSESAMCGNGARAVARLLDMLGLPLRIALKSGRALDVVRTADGLYSVPLGPVMDGGAFPVPQLGAPPFRLYQVCGEPHAVALMPSLSGVPLEAWGRLTVPRANCTVVSRSRGGEVAARTFERGVNRETLSCGTGATAAAQRLLDAVGVGPDDAATINVRMRGGLLRVRVVPGLGSYLEGSAEVWELNH